MKKKKKKLHAQLNKPKETETCCSAYVLALRCLHVDGLRPRIGLFDGLDLDRGERLVQLIQLNRQGDPCGCLLLREQAGRFLAELGLGGQLRLL